MLLDSGKYWVCSKCHSTMLIEDAERFPQIIEKVGNNSAKCKLCGSSMKVEDMIVKGHDGINSNFRIDKDKDNKIKLRMYSGTEKRVVIPDFVTDIESSAFSFNEIIEEVVLPEGLNSIGFYAFSGCKNLKRINIPSTLQYVGKRAFLNCASLTGIILPEDIRRIRLYRDAFDGCVKLQEEWRLQGRCPCCGFKLKKSFFKKICERCQITF